MRFNGVILKKFGVMDDEIARLRALGEVTIARLDQDHFLRNHLDDLTAFRDEVAGVA